MSNQQPEEALDVVISSTDGEIGIKLVLYEGTYPVPDRIAAALYFTFHRSLSGETGRVGVVFSDHIQFIQPKDHNLPASIDRKIFMREAAYARIGEFLDSNGLLPATARGQSATAVECLTYQFDAWQKRPAPDDNRILAYIRGKLYWCWRYDLDIASFTPADCLRLNTSIRNLARVAQIGEGRLWTNSGSSPTSLMLKWLSAFVREEHERRDGVSTPAGNEPIAILLAPPRYAGPRTHWEKAERFSRGESRDLANAAKEGVCAVEGLARVLTGRHSDTLGDLIKHLRAHYQINAAMVKSLEGIWGFTSNFPGVRHGGATEETIGDSDARFVLDGCEAAIRFLLTLDK